MTNKSMTRSLILVVAAALAYGCGVQRQADKKNDGPPNIVFILADDHAYQAISAYGSLVQTPHIDRIASEGALFEQARVTNSICSPSRAVILTGKYSHVNGMMDNGTDVSV